MTINSMTSHRAHRRRGYVAALSVFFTLAAAPALPSLAAADIKPTYGIAMVGRPALPADFTNLPYANPNAPKGGVMRIGVIGGFDSLNPFIVRGRSAANLRGLVYQSLMARSWAEPFSLYPLLAQSVKLPAHRRWVEFEINPQAVFSDGRAVTAADVEFSLNLLRDKGRPNFANLYSKVTRVSTPSARTIRFDFAEGAGREIPLLMGLMPILPRHATDADGFDKTTTAAPIGSGPYVVSEVDVGRRISYKRNPNYWAADVAAVRGLYNFDEFVYEYFRDRTSAEQAFSSGLLDMWALSSPAALRQMEAFAGNNPGKVAIQSYDIAAPTGMDALVMNSRRPPLDDLRVRRALTLLFDYETVNRAEYDGQYQPIRSFWDRSNLSSCGRAMDRRERTLVSQYPGAVSADMLRGNCMDLTADAMDSWRERRRLAGTLLSEAGYRLEQGRWINVSSGQPLSFEVLYRNDRQERVVLNYANALRRAGIEILPRRVDSAQFQARRTKFDYDIIPNRWFLSLSPGAEQYGYWGADSAQQEGSRNYMGVREPVIDNIIAAMLRAGSTQEITSAVRALDRVLLSRHWVIPLFAPARSWVAHSADIGVPQRGTVYGYFVESWWHK